MNQFARIREDVTRDKFCYRSRTDPTNKCRVASGTILPETVRNFHGPSSFKLGPDWQKLVTDLNAGEPTALKYLNHLNSGWRNLGAEWQMEGLSFAGNVVEVTNKNLLGDKSYVVGLDVTKAPPAGLNFTDTPTQFHVFTCVKPDGSTTLPSIGIPKHDAELYIVGNMQDYRQRYYLTKDLEFFPALPYAARVMADRGLLIHDAPSTSAPVVASVLLGDVVNVLEYRPRGREVWGRTVAGWVALLHPSTWYTTTWAMQTPPPL